MAAGWRGFRRSAACNYRKETRLYQRALAGFRHCGEVERRRLIGLARTRHIAAFEIHLDPFRRSSRYGRIAWTVGRETVIAIANARRYRKSSRSEEHTSELQPPC